ncbi:hypothetical protein C0995_003586 [Termitomyces sp. Mi166|nr:hypothetical protein C0995_003586 [Termitomyces sp. Mi166\
MSNLARAAKAKEKGNGLFKDGHIEEMMTAINELTTLLLSPELRLPAWLHVDIDSIASILLGMDYAPLPKIKQVKKDRKKFIDAIGMAEIDKNTPWDLENEAAWYKFVKVFVSCSKIRNLHPGFDVFRQIKDEQVPEQKLKRYGCHFSSRNRIDDVRNTSLLKKVQQS